MQLLYETRRCALTLGIPAAHNSLYDITHEVEAIVSESGVMTGLVNVYVQGATAGKHFP